MASFICPVCGEELTAVDRSFRCEKGHSYDRAKSGYINLLPASGSGKRHGDDKLMVRARREFLEHGYYDRFAEKVAELTDAFLSMGGTVLDCGCGEGKYTADVISRLKSSGKSAEIFGIDISKDAVNYASKRCPEVKLAVASVGAIPMAGESVDVLLNIFSPFTPAEYSRVLKRGGYLLRAYPLENHLFELKALVYDKPYKNTLEDMTAPGFELTQNVAVKYSVTVNNNADIKNLFMMTPYYYKTGRDDQAKLDRADSLDVTLEFGIAVYRKEI